MLSGSNLNLSSAMNTSSEDILSPLPSEMILSEIERCDQGACWTISFKDEAHYKNRNNFLLILENNSSASNTASNPVNKDGILKKDCLVQTGETMDHLLQSGVYEDLVAESLCYASRINTYHTTAAEYEYEDASESDDVEDSCSDLDYVSTDLEDSDDLEIVFDDNVEASDWPKSAEFTPLLQSKDILDICDSLDGTHCLYERNIFPCVTSIRMTNMINISDRAESLSCIDNPLKHTWDQFASSYNFSKDSSGPIKVVDLKKGTEKKKVSFAVQESLVTVHPMVKWDFAYRNARRGPWERYACDRFHFQQRIRSYEQILGPMLEKKYQHFLSNVQ